MASLLAALRDLGSDRDYHRRMLRLMLPIALASILSSSLQIVDTLMIAMLGDVPVAAVGLANRYTYILSFFFNGITSGASIFGAQYWGDRGRDGLRRTVGLSFLLLLPIATLFACAAIFAPHWIMGVFSAEEAVMAAGCDYLRLMGAAYIFQAVTALLAALLKATEKPGLPVIASTIGIFSNILLNYLLIFGKLGLPALGVRGAALATLIAAALEAGVLILLSFLRKTQVSPAPRNMLPPTKPFFFLYLKTTVPVLFNEVGWALGVVAIAWVYASMGTAVTAASSVYETIKSFIVVCCVSNGGAGGILLGIELGAGRPENAQVYARRMLLLGVIISLVLLPILLVLIGPLLGLYREMSRDAVENLRIMLISLSLILPIKMFTHNLINGILRHGGDTRAAAIIDVASMWGASVLPVFITGYLLRLPLLIVFPLSLMTDVSAAIFAYRRYKQGYWMRKLS